MPIIPFAGMLSQKAVAGICAAANQMQFTYRETILYKMYVWQKMLSYMSLLQRFMGLTVSI